MGFLHWYPDCPNSPKRAIVTDASPYSNWLFSKKTGLISSARSQLTSLLPKSVRKLSMPLWSPLWFFCWYKQFSRSSSSKQLKSFFDYGTYDSFLLGTKILHCNLRISRHGNSKARKFEEDIYCDFLKRAERSLFAQGHSKRFRFSPVREIRLRFTSLNLLLFRHQLV